MNFDPNKEYSREELLKMKSELESDLSTSSHIQKSKRVKQHTSFDPNKEYSKEELLRMKSELESDLNSSLPTTPEEESISDQVLENT